LINEFSKNFTVLTVLSKHTWNCEIYHFASVQQVGSEQYLSWLTKWDSLLVNYTDRTLGPCQELKELVREGIPHTYRGRVWKRCFYSLKTYILFEEYLKSAHELSNVEIKRSTHSFSALFIGWSRTIRTTLVRSITKACTRKPTRSTYKMPLIWSWNRFLI